MAPLAATVAATVAVGVGLVLARSERERRRTRQRRRERRLGLQPGERLACGLRRMALGQVDLALEQLAAENTVAPSEQAVHETRKALKRLRALLRLLEHELGRKPFARENAALRDIARHLSEARDAAVMLSTLDALIARHPRALGRRNGVLELRRRLLVERAGTQQLTLADPAVRADVLGELHAFRWRVAAWSLPDQDGIELLEADLTRLYRQGRKRHQLLARGKRDRTIAMHEWRKRVKDLRYAAEILDRRGSGGPDGSGGSSGGHLRRLARQADELGELLGEEHDLAIFAERIRAGSRRDGRETWRTGRRTQEALLKLIARRRRTLRKRALRIGARLYRDKPKRFTRRIRASHASGARRLS